MTRAPARSSFRRELTLATLAFVLTFTTVAGLATTWSREASKARILVLGSGDALSLLITSGSSRLLIASGKNTTDFGNALNAALPPTIHRLDIVLLSASGEDMVVTDHALHFPDVSYRAFIGMPERELDDTAKVDVITSPRQFQLGSNIFVIVEPLAAGNTTSKRPWRAKIVHGGTTIVVQSNGQDIPYRDSNETISALIISRGTSEQIVNETKPRLIVLPKTQWQNPTQQPRFVQNSDKTMIVLPIENGKFETLQFTDEGIRIPSSVQPLPIPNDT